jgi:myo-inositol catabolism protein IolC
VQGWADLAELIEERDPYCRGAVILGLNQPLQLLTDSFALATNPIVKGFMVGRTLWATASLSWLKNDIDDDVFVHQVAGNFATLVEAWRKRLLHVSQKTNQASNQPVSQALSRPINQPLNQPINQPVKPRAVVYKSLNS